MDKRTKELICKRYLSGETMREMEKNLQVSRYRIRKVLRNHNIQIKSPSDAKKLPLHDGAFDRLNEHSVYWIGFISADGNIFGNKIKVMLAEKDIGHIQKFKTFLKSGHKILKNKTILNGKCYYQVGLSICSDKIVAALLKHNITANKSKTLIPSTIISEDLLPHYIRGIIDGDGCFSVRKDGQMKFVLTGSIYTMRGVQNILMKSCGLRKTKLRTYKKRSPQTYSLEYNGNTQVERIVDYLYKDASIFLDRKYNLVATHYSKE